ncbi:hypothetical protein FQA39_LY11277 [Lamprigera yunnana]|nr:hypothetical protein FQA39_LY11277 [Lamprigera yunnana]
MSQNKSIYLNNKFLYYLLILSGFYVFSENVKYKRLRKGLQIILVLVYIFILIRSTIIYIGVSQDTTFYRSSIILLFLSKVHIYGYPITTISSIAIAQIFNKTNIYVWKEINKIDDIIEKLGIQQKLLNQKRKIRYKSNVIITFYILQCILSTTENYMGYEILAQATISIINGPIKVQYYTFVNNIRGRFTILNNFLRKKLKTSSKRKYYELSEKVTIITDQHKRLTKLARTINKTYSFLLLTYICFNIGIVITHSYLLIFVSLSKRSLEQILLILYSNLPSLFFAAFELYIIASCSSLVCSEANATKVIFSELVINPQNAIAANAVSCKKLHILYQHKLLVDLARIVNKIYSFLLFSYICFDSVIVITHIYLLLHITVGGSTSEEMKNVVHLILPNMFSAAFDLWLLTSCSTVVCIEANATNEILYGITNDPQNTILPNRIIQISFHLMNNKLSITALKIFNVNFTMVYSILATTTNYLLIMLQFDLDLMKRSQKRISNLTQNL